MYLVWKERTVHRLKGGLQEADTEGSFRVGYLKRIVGCHGVVHVIELKSDTRIFSCNKGGTALTYVLYSICKGRFLIQRRKL